MSDAFDPDKYLSESESFDPDQYLQDSEESVEATALPAPVEQALSGTVGATVGGTLGLGAKKAGQLTGNVVDAIATKVGALDADQMSKITSNPQAYREARDIQDILKQQEALMGDIASAEARTSSQLLSGVKGQAEAVKNIGFSAAEEAKKVLPKELPKQKFIENVADTVARNVQTWGGDIDPEMQADIIRQTVDKPTAKTATDLKKVDNELSKLQNQLDMLKNDPQEFLGPKYQQVQSQTQDALKRKEALMTELSDLRRKGYDSAAQKLQKGIKLPSEILEAKPELLGKALAGTPGKVLDKIVKEVSALGVVNPDQALQIMRDSADFNALPASEQKKIATEFSESWDKQLKKMYPEYAEKKLKSSTAIKIEEALKSLGVDVGPGVDTNIKTSKGTKLTDIVAYPDKFASEYAQLQDALNQASTLTGTENPLQLQEKLAEQRRLVDQAESLGFKVSPEGQVQLSASARAKVAGVLANPKTAPNEAARLTELLEKSRSYNPQAGDLLKEAELSSIKGIVDDSVEGLRISGVSPKVIGARGLESMVTKGQELYALAKGSGAAKALGKAASVVGDVLPYAGAVLGGTMGYASAAEAGLPEGQRAAVGAVGALEESLPFPSPIDATKATVEGLKEYNRTGEVVPALKVATQTATAPIEKFGTERSLSARERMEQNLKAFKESKKQFKPMAPAYSQEEVRSSLESFKASSDPAAKAYISPLEKAMNAPDERTRGAIMFGLEQQPAFRELQRKK
jgi:conjugal transfer/entry exclusion protein